MRFNRNVARAHRNGRVFVGLQEIGDFTLCLTRGLRELGLQVTNVVWELRSPLLHREYAHDRYIPSPANKYAFYWKSLVEFLRQAPSHNIFIFNYGQSFLGPLLHSSKAWARIFASVDLLLLKLFQKKVVVVINGDDLRSRRLILQEMKAAGLHDHVRYAEADLDLDFGGSDDLRRRRARIIEKYADHIFARPNSTQLLRRSYHLLWLPLDLRTVEFRMGADTPPLIIHAPSDDSFKGTKYVLEAVERLRGNGYEFRFELCRNLSNVEVRRRLAESQIAIDQLILPGYGLFAVEAMASGNAVLGSAVSGYNGFGPDMPVVTTTPANVYENLRLLLEDRERRFELAVEGRKYVEKYHDHLVVAQDFVDKIGAKGSLARGRSVQ